MGYELELAAVGWQDSGGQGVHVQAEAQDKYDCIYKEGSFDLHIGEEQGCHRHEGHRPGQSRLNAGVQDVGVQCCQGY